MIAKGACVVGDLNAAIKGIARHWYLPIVDANFKSTLKSTANGLEWYEVKLEGSNCSQASDMPAPECDTWKEISRVQYDMPSCK